MTTTRTSTLARRPARGAAIALITGAGTALTPLPRTSRAQATAGVHVDRAHLQPGDLIFFYSPVGRVGMYIGNGQMVHSSTYGKPVAVAPVDSMSGYNTARRVV